MSAARDIDEPLVPADVVARELGCTPRTVRNRNIPVAREGRPGRGGATLYRMSEVRAWRDGEMKARRVFDAIARAQLGTLKRDISHDIRRVLGITYDGVLTLDEALDIPKHRAAAFHWFTLAAIYRELKGEEPEDLQGEAKQLEAIAKSGRQISD